VTTAVVAEPRRQLGLRARVTVAFALGALALSTVLSVVTYGLVRNSLVTERESSALSQAYANARVVRDGVAQAARVSRRTRAPAHDAGR